MQNTERAIIFLKKTKGNGRKETHARDKVFQRVEFVLCVHMHMHVQAAAENSVCFDLSMLEALRGLLLLNAIFVFKWTA